MQIELPPIVYVMGPSGAGKDSLLRFARVNLRADEKIAFAHRYITRATDFSGENHIALTHQEFALRRDAGLFAFDWDAHGIQYGIGLEIEVWRRAGLTVVMNGSRQHFANLRVDAGVILPVLITASPEILAERLSSRGRESQTEILARLRRQGDFIGKTPAIVIENSGRLETAGEHLLNVMRHAADAAIFA